MLLHMQRKVAKMYRTLSDTCALYNISFEENNTDVLGFLILTRPRTKEILERWTDVPDEVQKTLTASVDETSKRPCQLGRTLPSRSQSDAALARAKKISKT